ncbi:MAG TPA: fused MFS/spermidine synthase [Terriglobales bacterium]|jgi:spermidine synthase|nr:fused MFS/spermidine synthase [Terriglobales bacterium]
MRMRWFFVFFFFSGFCSLLYEVIWLRLGMAQFGVTTPIISIFLSLFMAGLGLGSWLSGRWMRNIENHSGKYPLRFYALTELLIGLSAWAVPAEMRFANSYFENYGGDLSVSSLHYYWIAGLWLTLILLPWCTCMGATFPLAMAAIRKLSVASKRSFSFLYLANVLGAVLGALLPAFVLVELFGFRNTMKIAALCNLTVAAFALLLSTWVRDIQQTSPAQAEVAVQAQVSSTRLIVGLLFLTGLVSLAMEVIWVRQFTPYMGTEVYTFACILGCYLLGTFIGSRVYRHWLRKHGPGEETVAWLLLGVAGLIPLLMTDLRLPLFKALAIIRVLGIMPITGLLGFVTPMLVDQYSEGDPDRAGKAYAVNIIGCILGPVLSGFLLLPALGERWSLILLTLPLFMLLYVFRPRMSESRRRYGVRFYSETIVVALALIIFTKDFITRFSHYQIRRDYAATVVATGQGMEKQLFVNGVGITKLTSITKTMAHLPLAFHTQPPKDALVICFGMGTTHRSLLSWGISATAVELVPSVPQLFSYYHSDGDRLLQSSNSHVVIDDGRLFLEKTRKQFDVITIDPPPPISAAGVSLLYTREFYDVVKRRLRPGGILEQWIMEDDKFDMLAMIKALKESFPYVRGMVSVEGWGLHVVASMSPIPNLTPAELASRMPPAAVADFLEWGPGRTAEEQFAILLAHEIPLDEFLRTQGEGIPPLDDDRPVNEYFLLRSWLPEKWSRAL